MSALELKNLSLEEKVGQLFFVGIPGPEFDDATHNLIERVRPGGVCMFARNIREAAQTRQLLDDVRLNSKIRPLLSLDQEGGLVDRLRRVVTPMPAPSRIQNSAQAKRFGELIAEVVRILGFDMDFAPVVDVIDDARSGYSNGLHSRAFGKSADDVIELATAFLHGLEAGGVTGCLKHFPGLGASQVDSHEELPVVRVGQEEFLKTDLFPYRRILEQWPGAAVMIAHAAFPELDLQESAQNGKLLPSSLSFNFVTKLLRQQLGFKGVAITDDLEMGAIVKNFGIGEACRLAILAGEDMLAICASAEAIHEGFEAVKTAIKRGTISELRIDESLDRIAALKERMHGQVAFDPDRLNTLSREITEFTASL